VTAPAIWTGADLDSIIFSDEEQRPGCKFRECSAEALYEGTFAPVNGTPCCHGRRIPYCLAHKDHILRAHQEHLASGNSFTCPHCPGSKFTLTRMEPIR
jgi:hypothetical protein